jgi:uncharacterized membrane protein
VQKPLALALTLGACLWTLLLVATPYAAASRHPVLVTAAAFVYQGAGLICHQRPERSFHLGGAQLPVCGRCFGLYISAALGAAAAWLATRQGPPRRVRLALAAAAVPTALTVSLEFVGAIHPGNAVRAISALPLGATAAWVFVRSLRAEADSGTRAAIYTRGHAS